MHSQPLKTRPRNWRGPVRWTAAALAVFLPIISAAGAVEAVTTPGSGDLTICRSWIVYASCNTYHKVPLPTQVAVGDAITVTYGSNPKDYVFHVARILQQDKGCKILSDASDAKGEGERIEVAKCQPADEAPGEAQGGPRKTE